MRPVLAAASLALALAGGACSLGSQDTEPTTVNPGSGSGSAALECETAADCVGAAATCCECPSYALPAGSGWGSSCGQVQCDPAPSCDEVAPACDQGACVLACQPVSCDLSCATGFAVDAAGCQVCACAAAPPGATCAVDTDCARVPADCCGCARGGADTAVPADQAGDFVASLGCDASSDACPDVDVCVPDAAPRCVDGTCALVDPNAPTPMLPAGACGRPDLPACPDGQTCVLNASSDAAGAGVGVCAS